MLALTPVLIVDRIEDQLVFWRDRLGYSVAIEVPFEDRLGFVKLHAGDTEIMLQSKACLRDDVGKTGDAEFHSMIYVRVKDLEAIKQQLEGLPWAVAPRTTFYESKEVGVLDPAGNLILFAQFPQTE